MVGGEGNDVLYGGDGDDSGILPKFLPDPDAENIDGALTPELQDQFEAFLDSRTSRTSTTWSAASMAAVATTRSTVTAATTTLDGGDGNDVVDGGKGSDTLIGGLGKDNLTGGASADSFLFDVAAGKANMDGSKTSSRAPTRSCSTTRSSARSVPSSARRSCSSARRRWMGTTTS